VVCATIAGLADSTGVTVLFCTAFSKDMPPMTLREFQQLIRAMYHDKDASRGVEGTFMWLTEEIGELATALRSGTHEEKTLEFADVLAWLATIANVVDVDLEEAVARKYGTGCPGCGQLACVCPDAEKP
jgi:NTP pyrophosphatase (non-canonical NTP hydrolase)